MCPRGQLDSSQDFPQNRLVRIGRVGPNGLVRAGTTLRLVLARIWGYDSAVAIAVTSVKSPDIPDSLLFRLREYLVTRQVQNGIALLDANASLLDNLDPEQPNAAALVGAVAQWVDVGYRDPDLVEQMLGRFPRERRGHLPVSGYVHLRMAEGLLALLRDLPDDALRHFDQVLALQDETEDKVVISIAYCWDARCHRKKGEYDVALKRAAAGSELADKLGFPKMAAVIRVLESWLHFQKGNAQEAQRVLNQAEEVLRTTDDDITLGNIYSAHGRIIRRHGQYNQAMKFFTQAIEHFRRRNPQHRNLARSLANMAYVQRLIAGQITRRMDSETKRRRGKEPRATAKTSVAASPARKLDDREQYEKLRAQAFANLDQAEKIYRHHSHHHGIGNVFENRGLLYLDSGELDLAAQQGALCYAEAKEHNDNIVMARARLLQCKVEQAQLDEQIEDDTRTWEHVQAVRDFSREAVEAAQRTQNQRLRARAYIWRGLSACNPAIQDIDDARHCLEQAALLTKAAQDEDVWTELQILKQKLTSRGSIDQKLRAWSRGVTEGKSFQRLADEFAELVITRVWEKEGKKVARVAKALKVSPKKIRKVLAMAGKRKR